MKKIKVLYISDSSKGGGATYSLIDMLRKLSYYIDPIVVIPEKGTIEKNLKDAGVDYLIQPFISGYGEKGLTTEKKRIDSFVDNFNAAMKLKQLVVERHIDLIHSNSSASNVGSFLSVFTNKPIVLHVREALEPQFECEYWDEELKVAFLKKADYVISISEAVKSYLLNRYAVDSDVIYNGIEKDIYFYETDNNTFPSKFYIAGDITKCKGQFDAIRAMQILNNQFHKNADLTIVGSGAHKSIWAARRLVKKLEMDESCQVGSFVMDMRLFRSNYGYALVCSDYEGLGRVTVEAMMAGNFVIGANTGATREIIGEDGARGLLYRCGDAQDLAQKMKEALELPIEIKQSVLKNAQEYAVETFDTRQYAQNIYNVYKMVLSKMCNGKREIDTTFSDYIYKKYEEYSSKQDKNRKNKEWKAPTVAEVNDRFSKTKHKEKLFMNFCNRNSIKTVAIYGMGFLGCEIYDIFQSIGKRIVFVSDRTPDGLKYVVKIIKPEDEWEDADIIVNTVIRDRREADDFISSKGNYRIVHIEEILNWNCQITKD